MMVSAHTVERVVLSPALDARALNMEQAKAIYNETPEADSLIEHLVAINRSAAARQVRNHVVGMARLCGEIGRSNFEEGQRELAITAAADSLVTDLRRVEHSGNGHAALSAKSLARALRGHLDVIASAHPKPLQLVDATRAVDRVLAQAPAEQVLSDRVAYELGKDRMRLLSELVARRDGQVVA